MKKRVITKTFIKEIHRELRYLIKDYKLECDFDILDYEYFNKNETDIVNKAYREGCIRAEMYTKNYLNSFMREIDQYFNEKREDLKLWVINTIITMPQKI